MTNVKLANTSEIDRSTEAHDLSAGELQNQIGLRLRFAQAAVWNDLVARFRVHGIRPQHFAAMTFINAFPACKQQELGEALGISRSNLVALIDELIQISLVARYQNPDDRRSNALHLTSAGREALVDMNKSQSDHENRLAELLSSEEQKILISLLRKVSDI